VPPSPSADDLSFDAVTALRPRSDGSTFDLDVHPLWTVGDKPNGGFLLALLGRAAAQALDGNGRGTTWDVQSATVTYLAAPALTAAEIRTTVLREGRTASHVRAVLVQSERTLVDAVLVLGAIAPGTAPRYDAIAPLRIPAPDRCVRLPPLTPEGVPVGVLVTTDLRLDPLTVPGTPPTGDDPPVAELRGWLRFADGREPDPAALLYFVDAIPPATLLIGSTGWVPTLSMSVYVRARPAPGWLGIRFTAQLVAAGTVDEACTLRDSEGHVVAQATQLARLRFPDDTD
jgi:hypothetical protein